MSLEFYNIKQNFSNLFLELKQKFEEEEHPLSKHIWTNNNSIAFRQISIFPKKIIDGLHYEIYKKNKKIFFEIHYEKNINTKLFEKLITSLVEKYSTKYKLKKWCNTKKISNKISLGSDEEVFGKLYNIIKTTYEDLQEYLIHFVNDMMPYKYQQIINEYHKFCETPTKWDEAYKWKTVDFFQQDTSVETINNVEYLSRLFSIQQNLVNNYQYATFKKIVENFPNVTKKLFENIFDEDKDLKERFEYFDNTFNEHIPKLNDTSTKSKPGISEFAFFLTCKYPDKYYLYRDGYYKDLVKYFELEPGKNPIDKYLHYLDFIEKFNKNYVIPNQELQDLTENLLKEKHENLSLRPNKNILAQSIIYVFLKLIMKNTPNYWIFQANPKYYDIFNSLNENKLSSWQVNQFKNEIKEGDKLILWVVGEKGGIYALADIVSDVKEFKDDETEEKYYFFADENKIRPRVNLELSHNLIKSPILRSEYKSHEKLIDLNVGNQGTNFKATKEQYDTILKIIENKQMQKQENNKPKFNLNQILYGPPGTGKTYNTINEAVKIVEELSDAEFKEKYGDNRKKLKDAFKKYLEEDEPHIAFCTFHQSFSYEDFIEGIKPVLREETEKKKEISEIENSNDLEYKIEDGIFKKMAQIAKESRNFKKIQKFLEKNKENTEIFYKLSFSQNKQKRNEIYKFCTENNKIAFDLGGNIDYSNCLNETDVKNLAKTNDIDENEGRWLSYFMYYLKKENYFVIYDDEKYINAIGKVIGEYYFEKSNSTGLKHFRNVDWLITDAKIPVSDFYKNSFNSDPIYKLKNDDVNIEFLENKKINHVLIIDEINRGNISQIFGELITLIEYDKRSGEDEELSVILPYSKTKFSVPPNLHIIGTMNTADRSIEALDTALRRRFTFKEMPPKTEVIDEEITKDVENKILEDVNLMTLLDTINNRIEKLLDKDHKIGHSYFLKVKTVEDLQVVFRDKIIPLLEEYFYGDYGKIGLVLGDAFVDFDETKNFNFAGFKGYEPEIEDDFKQRKVYKITNWKDWNKETFEKIYK